LIACRRAGTVGTAFYPEADLTMKSTLFRLLAIAILTMGVAHVPEAQAESKYLKLFKKLDTNRDKRLSEQEFAGEKGSAAMPKARRQFRSHDDNGDKSLSLTEFKKAQTATELRR
jgi:hypothetical protein